MKSKKRPLQAKAPRTGLSTDRETTLRFYLPKDLAVKAWNMAALEKLSFNDYCIKLLLEDEDRLREEEGKILKFSGSRRTRRRRG